MIDWSVGVRSGRVVCLLGEKNRFLCENDIDLFIFTSSTRINHNGLVKCLLQKYKISLISQACHLHLQDVYISDGGTSEMNV